MRHQPPCRRSQGYVLDLTDEQAVKSFFAALGFFDHLVFTAGETLKT
jgi:hypothetical protein